MTKFLDRALPSFEISRHEIDAAKSTLSLRNSEENMDAAKATRKEKRLQEEKQERHWLYRLVSLAWEAGTEDISSRIGGGLPFQREWASPWVDYDDSDPDLMVQLRTWTQHPIVKEHKLIGSGTYARIQCRMTEKSSGQPTRPDIIIDTSGSDSIYKSVDDLRGRYMIVPGMPEWDQFVSFVEELEDLLGVEPNLRKIEEALAFDFDHRS